MGSIYLHGPKAPYGSVPDDVETRLLLTAEDVVTLVRILGFYRDVTSGGHQALDNMIIHEIDKAKAFVLEKALHHTLTEIERSGKQISPEVTMTGHKINEGI